MPQALSWILGPCLDASSSPHSSPFPQIPPSIPALPLLTSLSGHTYSLRPITCLVLPLPFQSSKVTNSKPNFVS